MMTYIHALKNNIISLDQLVEKGYDIIMRDNSLVIQNLFIVNVEMTNNRMFTLVTRHADDGE